MVSLNQVQSQSVMPKVSKDGCLAVLPGEKPAQLEQKKDKKNLFFCKTTNIFDGNTLFAAASLNCFLQTEATRWIYVKMFNVIGLTFNISTLPRLKVHLSSLTSPFESHILLQR